jgi:glycosyltransferase involved in cell wall biosynthesis
LVSNNFPSDPRAAVSGVFQRLRMFIDAWKDLARLRILFYVPADVDVSAPAVRAREATLKELWNVDVRLTLCPQAERANGEARWASYARGALNFFRQPGYAETSGPMQVAAFESLAACDPDVIFAHRLASMCPALLSEKRLPPILFDLDDIEHVSLWRAARRMPEWKGALVHSSRLAALCWGERRAMSLASRTFVCSEGDRRYLENLWRVKRVRTIPNAVDIAAPEPVGAAPILMFVGSYRYGPNVHAAEFLVEKVWPRVIARVPGAELWVVGPAPENIGAARNPRGGIQFTGLVEDIAGLYHRARVIGCPVFAGGGTRIKILEAAAHARPVVATRLGAEGLELIDGKEILLRDDAESFAAACAELLSNPKLCEQLGAAAYQKARQLYDRRAIVSLIRSQLVGESSPPAQEIERCAIP